MRRILLQSAMLRAPSLPQRQFTRRTFRAALPAPPMIAPAQRRFSSSSSEAPRKGDFTMAMWLYGCSALVAGTVVVGGMTRLNRCDAGLGGQVVGQPLKHLPAQVLYPSGVGIQWLLLHQNLWCEQSTL